MLNNYWQISVISIFILLSGCVNNSDLKTNETVLFVFTEAEANDLQSIHDFFTDKICAEVEINSSDPEECYKKYLIKNKETGPASGVLECPWKPYEEIDLFEKLESGVFNEIWQYGEYIDSDGIVHKTINLNVIGKYPDYLNLLGKEHRPVKQYLHSLQSFGILSATMISDMLIQPEKYDVSDCRIRLVIAIHYLTFFYQDVG